MALACSMLQVDSNKEEEKYCLDLRTSHQCRNSDPWDEKDDASASQKNVENWSLQKSAHQKMTRYWRARFPKDWSQCGAKTFSMMLARKLIL